jgi:hypothetical protein
MYSINQPMISMRNMRIFDWTGAEHPWRHLDLPSVYQNNPTLYDSGADVDVVDSMGGSWTSVSIKMD